MRIPGPEDRPPQPAVPAPRVGPAQRKVDAKSVWSFPSPLGVPGSVDSLGGAAAPLLAGFSFTGITITITNADSFRAPGPTMLVLSTACLLMLFAVECSLNAKRYLWSRGQLAEWVDGELLRRERRGYLEQQQMAYRLWAKWARRAVHCYNVGIVFLLLGLASVLAPEHGSDEPAWRWAAACFVCGAALLELVWTIRLERSHVLKASATLVVGDKGSSAGTVERDGD